MKDYFSEEIGNVATAPQKDYFSDEVGNNNLGKQFIDAAVNTPKVLAKSGAKAISSINDTVQNAFYHPIKTAQAIDQTIRHPIKSIKDYAKDRYDSPENIKNTLANDPFGVIMDATVVSKGGGAAVLKKTGQIAATAGKVIPEGIKATTAGIHNSIVKLPNKAFRFSKEPLDVLNKEGITANTTADYANIAKQRLAERSKQLEDAIQNSDQTLNVESIVNKYLDDAASKATGSLKDRGASLKELEFLKTRIVHKYGDLNNLKVQDVVKLKRDLAEDFPFVAEDPNNINTKAAHKIYHDLNEAVEAAHPEIKELNHRVSGLIDISHAAVNRAAAESRNPFTNFDKFIGLGGLLSGNPIAGAAIVGAKKVLGSPAVQTRVANAAYKIAGGKTKIPVSPVFKSVEAELIKKEIPKKGLERIPYQKEIKRPDRLISKTVGNSDASVIKAGTTYRPDKISKPYRIKSEKERISIGKQFKNPNDSKMLDYLSEYLSPKQIAAMSPEKRLEVGNMTANELRDFVARMESHIRRSPKR